MKLPVLAGIFLVVVMLGYRFYGGWIARFFRLNDAVVTPSHERQDGVDFVPTKPFYLLGQHFSAIAAAGPIAGPILACQLFGWLPCLLWIGLGVVFIGAVHDFSALVASVRHHGHSVAQMIRENIGPRAWLAMMGFIWLSLIYVIVAFTDITAGTFVGRIEELDGVKVGFERGGAVAAASAMYLLLSIVMGLVQKKWNPPLWLVTLLFVPATLGVVWLGTQVSTVLLFTKMHWGFLILLYCFVASLLPVWMLLQPRGYLGGFVLYLALAVGVIGIFFGGYDIQQASFKTWNAPGLTGSLFPFLFVTIACGACSGFHGLVCSGTTSKQIDKETHCRPVGYGAMLLEGFVAVIALATIMILSDTDAKGAPGTIYGAGMGRFLTLIVGEDNLLFAMTFGALAFSTFVFDTLDVSTRLGRYILQELTGRKGPLAAGVATAMTAGLPAVLLLIGGEGGWQHFWVLFGTSNQLLAGLTLLGVTVWLHRTSRRYWFTLLPMIFVMTITFWSLFRQIQVAASRSFEQGLRFNLSTVNGAVALLLSVLAALVILEATQAVRRWGTRKGLAILLLAILPFVACQKSESTAATSTFEDEFGSGDSLWDLQTNSPGAVTFGIANAEAEDGFSVKLVLQGNEALGVEDYASPPSANQIATKESLSFGTYRARLKAASCSGTDEEVVTGVFVYSNDGEDRNGNGIVDNNEIDIEIACSLPKVLWLTIWTDYTDDTLFRKVTRRVDLADGSVRQTAPGAEGEWGVGDDLGQAVEGLPVAGFSATAGFYEMGFDWSSDRIRFFIVVAGEEITLWDFDDTSLIPQGAAQFMLNLWHSSSGWDDDEEADYPASDAVLEADWVMLSADPVR